MTKRLNKQETLLEFLNVIAPKPYYMDLLMAEGDFVRDLFHKAAAGQDADDYNISPEAKEFVKTQTPGIYKNLAKFLEKIRDAEFYDNSNPAHLNIVKKEITGFLCLFNAATEPEIVKYYTVASDVYALLK